MQTVIITWCMRMSVLFWTFRENLRSFPHDSFLLFSVCSLNVGRLFQLNRPLLMFCYAFCIQSFRGRSVFFLLSGENPEIAAVAGMSPHVPTPAQLSCLPAFVVCTLRCLVIRDERGFTSSVTSVSLINQLMWQLKC